MTTPSTSTPEPTGEADVRLVDGYVQRLRFKARRGIAGAQMIIDAWKRLRSSLPTAPAAPAPVPEGQEVERIAKAAREFVAYERDHIRAQVMPEYERMRGVTSKTRDAAWRVLSAAVDSHPAPAAPLPGGADLEWLLNVAETYYGKGTNVECKAGVQRAERVRASLLVPAPSNQEKP